MLSTLLLSVLAPAALAADTPLPDRLDGEPGDQRPTVEDVHTLDTIRGLAVDTRGTHIGFIRARWDEDEDGRVEDLWLLDTRRRTTLRLTFTDGDLAAPAFSPDGETLYVLADDEDGHRQLHRIDRDGGPLQPLTALPDGIARWRLDPSGEAAYLVTHDEQPIDDAWAGLRAERADVTYVDRARTTSRIHRVDLTTFRVEPVWTPDAYIVDFDVTRGGERIAAITAPDVELIRWEGETEVRVLSPETGTDQTLTDTLWRADAPSPYGWLSSPTWSSDGRALAFQVDFDGYPGEVFVAEFADDDPEIMQLERPREVHPARPGLRWVPGRRDLCMGAAERARRRVVCWTRVGSGSVRSDRTVPGGDVVVEDFAFSGDGRDLIAYAGTPERFPELYRLPARGNLAAVPLTELNPHTVAWTLPDLSTTTWTAPDGVEVSGVLELPPGWTPDDGPLPLMVLIHGGPTSQARLHRSLRYHGRTLLASMGFAVLLPNYRGSTGYGDAFMTQLIGREADIEVADILAGVDHLVAEGIADPDRLAVGGWSNGGFLTNAIITQTDRFKAAISGAGVADQTMQWALEDTPGHVINYMQGLPWEQPEAHEIASPIRRLGTVTTPTLFHVGAHDARVPPAHARAMFRGLDAYLGVPTELVIYPDTGHGLRSISQQRTKIAWDHAWLRTHLFAEAPHAGNEPVTTAPPDASDEAAAE